jgi:hypothetical protein
MTVSSLASVDEELVEKIEIVQWSGAVQRTV